MSAYKKSHAKSGLAVLRYTAVSTLFSRSAILCCFDKSNESQAFLGAVAIGPGVGRKECC